MQCKINAGLSVSLGLLSNQTELDAVFAVFIMGWSDLIKTGSDYYGEYGDCCQPVVDPYTYIALLAGVALVTWFLQMTIVMTTFTPPGEMRFRRDAHKSRPHTGFINERNRF